VVSVNPTAFDLHELLEEMRSLYCPRASAKGVVLDITHSDAVPRFVVTDENKLRQVFTNLLDNAVKFTDQGYIVLRVATDRGEHGELRLVSEIEDTGRGIAPKDVERMFRYFEQAEAAQTDGGTGLGLAICREFVHLLSGEIAVVSTAGRGSVFSFDIAIQEAVASDAPKTPRRSHVVGIRADEPDYRILVADDARDNRELVLQILEPIGFTVRSVSNGEEAVSEYKSWLPQLVLMDMRMPIMDGYEAIRRIRATPSGAEVAIIGITASAFTEMREKVLNAGADEIAVKPFDADDLLEKMGRLLKARYVYADETPVPQPVATRELDAEAVAALPDDLVASLRHAATIADHDAVLELTDEVGRIDERLAATLRGLAEQFDSEHILAGLPGGDGS
jgi:CheY-like chemotaxis protein